MIDQTSNEYGGGEETGQMIPPASGGPFPGAYKFSAEELRVLGECNSESFFQRSLPLGTALGLGTLAAVHKGYLKANARMGAFPKVTLAVVVGYLLGKLSYQRACAEKLMALPNSYIGQVLRDKKNYGDRRQPYTVAPVPPMLGAKPGDIYSDAGPGSSLDLDLDRPLFGDDYTAPPPPDGAGAGGGAGAGAGAGGLGAGAGAVAPQSPQSYDELRRRNRGDYSSARQDPYKVEPSPGPLVTRPRAPAPESRASTNKYGDIME